MDLSSTQGALCTVSVFLFYAPPLPMGLSYMSGHCIVVFSGEKCVITTFRLFALNGITQTTPVANIFLRRDSAINNY